VDNTVLGVFKRSEGIEKEVWLARISFMALFKETGFRFTR
jgi:hypothetical protein